LILAIMGKAAPRKPLATPSEKAAESSTSHAARQDKAKTAKIKEEKDTKVKKEKDAAASSILITQNLRGNVPPCEVSSSFAVDHESQMVFFNTYDENGKNSEIFSCDLRKRTWKNITVSTSENVMLGN
jgi:spore germination protein YaaH